MKLLRRIRTAGLVILGFGFLGALLDAQGKHEPASPAAAAPTAKSAPATKKPPMPDDVKHYLEEVGKNIDWEQQSVNLLVSACSSASDNPALILTNDWRIKAATACAGLNVFALQVQKTKPPKPAAAVHAVFLQIASESKKVANDFAAGVDHSSSAKIISASKRLETLAAIAKSGTSTINALKSHYAQEYP